MAIGFVALAITAGSQVLGLATLTATILVLEFGFVSALPLATEMHPDDRPRFLAMFVVAAAAGRVVADWIGPQLFGGGGMALVAIGGVWPPLSPWPSWHDGSTCPRTFSPKSRA